MSVSALGGARRRIPGEVGFKGSRQGLFVVVDDEIDFDLALEKLKAKLGENGSFFAGATVTADVGRRRMTDREVSALRDVLESHGLTLAGMVDESEPRCEQEGGGPMVSSRTLIKGPSRHSEAPVGGLGYVGERSRAEGAIAESLPTLLVKKTVRSGQRVRYAGNVVIVGDVNPGGEVAAAGDVIVLGTLRGVAHAGAAGDDSAVVAAVRLNPVQLRIGRYFSRSSPDDGRSREDGTFLPEVARVKDGIIVVEKLNSVEEPRR